MLSDIRHALRLLLKDRSFTITALLTLALCIGANTAIFSVVQSVLLKPLPIPDADRVVLVLNSYPNAGAPRAAAAVPDYFDRLTGVTALEDMALYRRSGVTLGAQSGAERLASVTATVLDLNKLRRLGWQARIGLGEGIAQTYRWFEDQLAAGITPRGVTAAPGDRPLLSPK